MKKDKMELLIEFTKDEDAKTRATAIAGLAKVGDPRGFAPVVVGLFDPVDEVRVTSAVALGVMREPRGFEPLVECLTDPCEQVAINCAWALGQLTDERCLDELLRIIADESYASAIRVAAITAVGERAELADSDLASSDELIGKARAGLLSALRLGVDEYCASAIWSLGHLPADEATVEACLNALDSENEWTVRYAIEALATFKAPQAKDKIAALCDDVRESVRDLANQALASFGAC